MEIGEMHLFFLFFSFFFLYTFKLHYRVTIFIVFYVRCQDSFVEYSILEQAYQKQIFSSVALHASQFFAKPTYKWFHYFMTQIRIKTRFNSRRRRVLLSYFASPHNIISTFIMERTFYFIVLIKQLIFIHFQYKINRNMSRRSKARLYLIQTGGKQ